MAEKQTSGGRAQDRRNVAAGQEHDVRYEAKKQGVSKEQEKATRSGGNSRSGRGPDPTT